MMQHSIRTFPDSCLRSVCKPVKAFGPDLERLVDSLRKTMRSQKMGIGIAAPQIGVSLQIALVDVSARIPGSSEIVLINPEIIKMDGEILSHEGCMSLPEYTGYVHRSTSVAYHYHDLSGRLQQGKSEGLEAICIQHEMDHLKGKLFFDRVVTLKTDMQPRHWKKKKR